ncbi:MAG: hypothetical protein GY804_11850, partial [Alphaproteobacteria bacterium]|nr:hypothetical protein [Alphaproteobacteria bacterium]
MALTANGLTVPTYEEVLDAIITAEQENVSSQIDVDDDTALGQTNQIMAAQIALVNELTQDIYDQRSIFNAEGKALDDNVSWLGVYRQGAAATAGECYFRGVDGTLVPAGSLVQNISSKENYTLDLALQISRNSCRDCTFNVLNVLDSTLYTLTVEGAAYEYTSDGSATNLEIIAGLVKAVTTVTLIVDTVSDSTLYRVVIAGVNNDYTSDASATSLEITAGLQVAIQANSGSHGVDATDNTDGTVTLSTSVVSDITTKSVEISEPTLMSLQNILYGINYTAEDNLDGTATVSVIDPTDITASVDLNMSFTESTSAANVTGVNTGILPAPANTVITILSPAGGWTSVFNPIALVVGREQETDQELRSRAINFKTAGGTATLDNMTSSLLAVDGVSSATITEKHVSECYNGSGDYICAAAATQNGGSVHVVVAGGTNDDVAQSIWDTKPAGVEVWALAGGTYNEGDAVDLSGDTQVIAFNRPTSINMTTAITYKVFDATLYPSTDSEAYATITTAIIDFGNALGAGENVVPSEFETVVYNAIGGLKEVLVDINGELSSNPADFVAIAIDEEAFF